MNNKKEANPWLPWVLLILMNVTGSLLESPINIAVITLSYIILLLYLIDNFKRFKNKKPWGDKRQEKEIQALYIIPIIECFYMIIIGVIKILIGGGSVPYV